MRSNGKVAQLRGNDANTLCNQNCNDLINKFDYRQLSQTDYCRATNDCQLQSKRQGHCPASVKSSAVQGTSLSDHNTRRLLGDRHGHSTGATYGYIGCSTGPVRAGTGILLPSQISESRIIKTDLALGRDTYEALPNKIKEVRPRAKPLPTIDIQNKTCFHAAQKKNIPNFYVKQYNENNDPNAQHDDSRFDCDGNDFINDNAVFADRNNSLEDLTSLAHAKRPALQAIENRSTSGKEPGHGTGRHLPSHTVYFPLGEVRLNHPKALHSNEDLTRVGVGTARVDEARNNAVNTITELTHDNVHNNNRQHLPGPIYSSNKSSLKVETKTLSHLSTDGNKSKSRMKSFLIKQSGNSKYYRLIPKFGDAPAKVVSATSNLASSKTISPKLLHSVVNLPSVASDAFKSLPPLEARQPSGEHITLAGRGEKPHPVKIPQANLDENEFSEPSKELLQAYVDMWRNM